MVRSEAQKLRKGWKGLPPGSSVGVEGASLRKTDAFMEAHPFGKVSRVLETVGGGNRTPVLRLASESPGYAHGR